MEIYKYFQYFSFPELSGNELFDKSDDKKDNENNEEKNIIDLLINFQLRKQYDKIPKVYKIPTYLFTRLDIYTIVDISNIYTIKLNFERKDIADMKGILTPDDAIYTSMMQNITRVQYDTELMQLNKKNNNLRIHYAIAFENNEDIRLITDAVKIMIFE